MAVHALEDYALAVEIESVAFAVFNGAEACLFAYAVERAAVFAQLGHNAVECRAFVAPRACRRHSEAYRAVGGACGCVGDAFAVDALHVDGYLPVVAAVDVWADTQRAVRAGVDGYRLYMCRRFHLDVDRAVYAAEQPEISLPFRAVHRRVGRAFFHAHFERVCLAVVKKPRYVVAETVEAAFVCRACLFAVYTHFGVGHAAFKHDAHALSAPFLGGAEAVAVVAGFGGVFRLFPAVVICAEALCFPAGRYFYLRPFAAVAPRCAHKVPPHVGIFVGSRQIMATCFNGRGTSRRCGEKCRENEQY